MTALVTPDQLEAKLRDIGARRYHRLHPFHHLLHGGKCSKGQVQAWALNRYYYQAMIPVKDASLIARCTDSDIRREWRRRILIHINNTNPILIEDSRERRAVEAAGFEVAEDGMRIEL